MAAPITYINSYYKNLANKWLKAYEPSSSVVKNIYFESVELSFVTKIKINENGFFHNLNNEKTVLYIKDYYDLYLFDNETDADNNNFASALKLADNISAEKTTESLNIPNASNTVFGITRFATAEEALSFFIPDLYLSASPSLARGLCDYYRGSKKATNLEIIELVTNKYITASNINLLMSLFEPDSNVVNFEVGDMIYKHKDVAALDSRFLLQDGSAFNTTTYAGLYALPEYNTGFTKDLSLEFFGDTKLYVYAKNN